MSKSGPNRTRAVGLALLVGAAIVGPSLPAFATGSLGSPGIEPTEQRFAIAIGPSSTTLWSSLAFDGPKGSIAVVLPVPVGTALDTSSRAFFEALEVATAPRVIPPNGAQTSCAGQAAGAGVAVEGDLAGTEPLSPAETVTFADAGSLESWAAAHGLVVSQSTLAALATFDATTRFVVMRYDTPSGPGLTRTLRAVLPGTHPVAPFVLTGAKSSALRIVTWEIGKGRSHLTGTEVEIDLGKLSFDVAQTSSNYGALRGGLLDDPQKILVESASHESLRDNIAIGTTAESVDGFVKTYFSRAKQYGDTTGDDVACAFQSAVVLGQTAVVSAACPRADLGYVELGTTCVESVASGEVDPQKLRCGGATDDLALMLSGLAGKDAWLTRSTLVLPPGKLGAALDVTFPTGPKVDAVYEAGSVDLSGCGGASSSSSTSTGGSVGSGPPPTSSAAGGNQIEVPLYSYSGCSCNGAYERVGYVEVDVNTAPPAYYEHGSGCSSDTSTYDTTPDNCSGDTSTSGDSCGSSSSSSTSSDGCSNSDGSSGCSGDGSSSDGCNSGSGDGCGSSSGSSDSCSNNCAVAGRGHQGKVRRVAPRFSGLVYALVALLVPLRRWMRPERRRGPRSHRVRRRSTPPAG